MAKPTAPADRTARPPAIPWCNELLGIKDGANESRRALALSGAAGPPVTGLILAARATPARAHRLRELSDMPGM
jgi:hypothetical protein